MQCTCSAPSPILPRIQFTPSGSHRIPIAPCQEHCHKFTNGAPSRITSPVGGAGKVTAVIVTARGESSCTSHTAALTLHTRQTHAAYALHTRALRSFYPDASMRKSSSSSTLPLATAASKGEASNWSRAAWPDAPRRSSALAACVQGRRGEGGKVRAT